ncbi:MAG: retroviral-like aspartic protease family protein [Gammaproteobacteria bacterium]|nr:retroviral-like aspartic protease family protein [Gammaproteobacteria bacterium]
MKLSFSVWMIMCFFAALAGYAIYTISSSFKEAETVDVATKTITRNQENKSHPNKTELPETNESVQPSLLFQVKQHLETGNYIKLQELVLNHYSVLNTKELRQIYRSLHLKASSLRRLEKSRESIALLKTIAAIFDDKESWKLIGLETALQKDWPTSYEALLKASRLENDSLQLTELLKNLSHAANLYTSSLLERKDFESALNVAESLYFSHPTFPQFQYNYAQALVAVGRLSEAKNILLSLKNEPNFKIQSEELLSNIEAIATKTQLDSKTNQSAALSTGEAAESSVEIPLNRFGTSFLAKTKINKRSVSLLLDTGASITALGSQTIQTLGLTPLGQTITLDTANGRTQSKLYRANSIELNGVIIQNVVIASIEMPYNPNFVGLLGTDILNGQTDSYSFVLDTSKPALIFKSVP